MTSTDPMITIQTQLFGKPLPAREPATVDHKTRALEHLSAAGTHTTGSTQAAEYIAAAQVHATLALVDQQRITNLIALAAEGLDIAPTLDDLHMGTAGAVWEGLGL